MKTKYNHILSLTGLMLITGCSFMDFKDAQLPSWSIQLEFPLSDQTVDLHTMLEDSLIQTIPVTGTGDSIFVFQDNMPIDRVEVGDQLNIDDINKSFAQSVDDVTIEDTEITESVGFAEVGVNQITKHVSSTIGLIELDDIAPSASDPFQLDKIYPDIALVPDSTNDSIPGFTLNPVVNSFSFEDFDQAVFTNGFLDVTIVNDMVITLGNPILIQLQETDGIDTVDIAGALVEFNTSIAPGDSATEVLSLAGKTLPGSLLIKVSGNSTGTNGSIIIVDSTAKVSSFSTKIGARDLEVSSATALVPSQTIDEIGAINMESDSNKVEQAEIATGNVQISIDNGLAVNGNLVLTIQSLEDPTGLPFEQTIPLVQNSVSEQTFAIDDHVMVMTITDQSVDYSYQIITEDSDPNMVTLDEADSVVVDINMFGGQAGMQITFKSFQGIVEPQDMLVDGSMNMDSDSEILEAVLSNGELNIEIINNINLTAGGIPSVNITLPELFASNGDTLKIGPADLNPGVNSLPVDLSEYTLKMARNSQVLNYVAKVVTPYGEVGSYSLQDSILINIEIAGLTFQSITGYFSQDAMVDSNTIALDNATKVQEAVINVGQLVLTMENHIGVTADINFQINEFLIGSSLLDTTLELGSQTTPQQHIIPLTGYSLVMPLDDQNVHYVSRIAIPSDTEMTLTFGDSIGVNVDIIGLSFQSITGKIDPVFVDIDTIEQEIDALPDELEGIEFAEVEMIMNFTTNIGVPVYLDLNITASNSDGETAVSSVAQHNITENNQVVIPNAEALINIKPDKIVASGRATVGSLDTVGTVASDQFIEGEFNIKAPLKLYLTESSQIELDLEEVDTEDFPEDLERIVLYADYYNQFDFGSQIEVLASEDTTLEGSLVMPDTLLTLDIIPNYTGLDSILLDEDEFDLFINSEQLYIKTIVNLVGEKDNQGNPLPSSFLSTDSLKILLWGSMQVLVDPEAEEED
ncbi:MAG: hypothetical protein H8E14_01190 [Candidatus Marinimicrobia bacterium]|nr:hypothetical protein [Candidatus Neomarinimicrobiota bacterium]